jgi:hypothetical protein
MPLKKLSNTAKKLRPPNKFSIRDLWTGNVSEVVKAKTASKQQRIKEKRDGALEARRSVSK